MTAREQQVLDIIRDEPMLPQLAIAERLGISRSAVAAHVTTLSNKGLIKGRGYVLGDAPFVALIGGANIDIHGKPDRPLRDADSNPGSVRISAGGVVRNVAENLTRMGVECRLISVVGNDQHGKMLLRLSRDAGIDMQHVYEISSAPTSTYLSVLDSAGEMQVAIADMDIINHLNAERLQSKQAMLQQSSLLILDTNLPDDTLAWLTRTFSGKPIFADTVSASKSSRLRPYLPSIHTLKTSTMEVQALTELDARTPTQLQRVARHLHKQGVQRVFITRGNQGVFYSAGEEQGVRKQIRRKHDVLNASGAGDAFLAGLAYAWLERFALNDTLQFGLAAADVTLSHSATSSPALSLSAIDRAMEMQGEE